MFCSKCGKQAEGEYCWNCGAKLYNPEKDNIAPVTEPTSIETSKVAKPELVKHPVSFTKFRATREYSGVMFDDTHQLIIIKKFNSEIKLRYSEILNAEVNRTYSSTSKTSTGSMIGRTAVGSLISPGAAMIGGATAKRTEEQKVESAWVNVVTSNVKYPSVVVGSFTEQLAETICAVFLQVKQMPPKEEAFELSEAWGTGDAPLKADYAPKSMNAALDSAPWRCPECDYKNPGSSSICLNCSEPKPKTYLDKISDTPENSDVWFCPKCDFKNKGGKSCRSCGSSKPAPEVKKSKKFFSKQNS